VNTARPLLLGRASQSEEAKGQPVSQRILHIIPTLGRGGVQRQVTLLAHGLPRAEFDVHICALGGNSSCSPCERNGDQGAFASELAEAEIPLTLLGRRWAFDPAACWRLQRQVAALRPQLLHTWSTEAGIYGEAVGWACGVRRWVASQDQITWHKGPIAAALERRVLRHSSRVAVNSLAVRDSCLYDGLPADKFCVIPRGVPPAEPPRSTRHQVLAELEIPLHHRLIGIVGPLWLDQCIKDAIWAADLLKVIRDDVHLLVIGDGPHRDRLRKFRDQVRIRDKVHFLGECGDVSRLVPHFDVLWSTGAYEGQANSILEAMAAGVPVVATDIPGTRELVEHETTGYLVPVGDRAEVTRCTNRLLNDAALAGRFGQAGRQRAVHQFSVEKMVQQYVDLYRAVLA
jgi:glycosyltransferase involved in cell wall biosynthesis